LRAKAFLKKLTHRSVIALVFDGPSFFNPYSSWMILKTGIAIRNRIDVECEIRDVHPRDGSWECGNFASRKNYHPAWARSSAIANPAMTISVNRDS